MGLPHRALDRDADHDPLRVRRRRAPVTLSVADNGIIDGFGVGANLRHAFEGCPPATVNLTHRNSCRATARENVSDLLTGFAGDNSGHSGGGVDRHADGYDVGLAIRAERGQCTQVVLIPELQVTDGPGLYRVRHDWQCNGDLFPNCPKVTTATLPQRGRLDRFNTLRQCHRKPKVSTR